MRCPSVDIDPLRIPKSCSARLRLASGVEFGDSELGPALPAPSSTPQGHLVDLAPLSVHPSGVYRVRRSASLEAFRSPPRFRRLFPAT